MNAEHTTVAEVDDEPTEAGDLLLRHSRGDRTAFPALMLAYRRAVYSYLVRCGIAIADRDDVFQDVFTKIHAAAPSYRAELPLHPWIFTIVANTVRTNIRRQRVRQLVQADPERRELPDPAPDGERISSARQRLAWLEQRIRELPLRQREVLLLTCLEDLSQQEVSRMLGLPVNTIKTHLRRARLALVQKLGRLDAREGRS